MSATITITNTISYTNNNNNKMEMKIGKRVEAREECVERYKIITENIHNMIKWKSDILGRHRVVLGNCTMGERINLISGRMETIGDIRIKGRTLNVIKYLKNSELLVSGCNAGDITVWRNSQSERDINNYRLVGIGRNVHKNYIEDIEELSNRRIAVCSTDNTLSIWSIPHLELIDLIPLSDPYVLKWNFYLGQQGPLLLTGGFDNNLRIWSISTHNNKSLKTINTGSDIYNILHLNSGLFALSGSQGIILYNIYTGKMEGQFPNVYPLSLHSYRPICKIHPNMLAAAGGLGVLQIFQLVGVTNYQIFHSNIFSISQIANGIIAIVSVQGSMKLFDVLIAHTKAIIPDKGLLPLISIAKFF